MKNLNKILSGLLVLTILSFGCERLLDVESDRLVFPDENLLDSPNDTIYSMIGIFSQLESVSALKNCQPK